MEISSHPCRIYYSPIWLSISNDQSFCTSLIPPLLNICCLIYCRLQKHPCWLYTSRVPLCSVFHCLTMPPVMPSPHAISNVRTLITRTGKYTKQYACMVIHNHMDSLKSEHVPSRTNDTRISNCPFYKCGLTSDSVSRCAHESHRNMLNTVPLNKDVFFLS